MRDASLRVDTVAAGAAEGSRDADRRDHLGRVAPVAIRRRDPEAAYGASLYHVEQAAKAALASLRPDSS
jgi:hypothetical protein